MRFALLLAVAGFFASQASAQVLLTENFDYTPGDTLTVVSDWINHSGTGDSLIVSPTNYSITGYPPSSGGSVVTFGGSGSREDAHLGFLPTGLTEEGGQNEIYSSMIVSVEHTDTDANGGYFFHLTEEPHNTTFRGRIFVRTVPPSAGGCLGGSIYQFGLSKGSTSTIAWESTLRCAPDDGPFLLVMKYTFVPDPDPAHGGGDNDTVDLFIFQEGDDFSTEPVTPDLTNIDTVSDLSIAGNVNLRQGSDVIQVAVDGIRVSEDWSDIVPVELVSFDATVSGSDLNLNWMTSSETNNAGFEVQLKGDGDYQPMGFVDGNGTTTVEQSYSYSINGLAPGTYSVRLKQIDYDGAFEYSPQVEVSVGVPGSHVLTQAYPNPFNPQASFSLSVATAQHVDVALFNALGQQVATLFSGQMEAGQARAITIDGANLPSGSYYYRAVGQNFSDSGRVTLLK